MEREEAEIKHARLAMLAAVGWPLAELLNPWIALDGHNGRAPSLFNGGLFDGPVPFFLVLAAGSAAYLEYVAEEQKTGGPVLDQLRCTSLATMASIRWAFPKKKAPSVKRSCARASSPTGRLAMLAITGFAVQEF